MCRHIFRIGLNSILSRRIIIIYVTTGPPSHLNHILTRNARKLLGLIIIDHPRTYTNGRHGTTTTITSLKIIEIYI